MKTLIAKQEWLIANGYIVGLRDPQLNTNYTGDFMVVEAYEKSELPTADGSNGPWCIVGDNLTELVCKAFDIWCDASSVPTPNPEPCKIADPDLHS